MEKINILLYKKIIVNTVESVKNNRINNTVNLTKGVNVSVIGALIFFCIEIF